MPIFGNPLGFLALAAIPVILAIHFLQRESRRLTASTLFLLEHLEPESAQGRRFQRLRSSVPLWLQLLAALLAAWLLVQPRWIRPSATQHIVLVVDSTVSMRAFREEMLRAVAEETAGMARASAHTEWQLLESDRTRPTLYSGPNRPALLEALKTWKPELGAHDPGPQLEAAQNLLGGKGTLIFVSDRKRELPAGVLLLAVGRPFDHCGFAGVSVEGSHWRALARNNGRSPQRRNWWVEAEGQKSAPQVLAFGPDATLELSGSFPPGASRCELVMDSDAFTLDSRLPFLQPRLKRLAVREDAAPPEFGSFFEKFLQSLERADAAGGGRADLELAIYDPFAPRLPQGTAIVFVSDPLPAQGAPPGSVTASGDPLAAGLNWSGLLVHDNLQIPHQPEDDVLVWQGERPLIFLRQAGAGSLLVVNFDLRASNAARLPAFVLLLHRFAEEVRAARVAPEARNFETGEVLSVSSDPHLPPPVLTAPPGPALRAPAEPGFFRVTQGASELVDGAAHFADARAADFREASSENAVRGETARTTQRNSQADLFAPVWMLALGAAMAGSWGWRRA